MVVLCLIIGILDLLFGIYCLFEYGLIVGFALILSSLCFIYFSLGAERGFKAHERIDKLKKRIKTNEQKIEMLQNEIKILKGEDIVEEKKETL